MYAYISPCNCMLNTYKKRSRAEEKEGRKDNLAYMSFYIENAPSA